MIDRLHEDVLKENIRKNGYDEDEVENATTAWQHTKTLIPSDFDDVVSGQECLFCKADTPNEKAFYADIMIAHKEPVTKKASILGLGKKNRVATIGSILPLKLGICKSCKRSFVIAYSLKIAIMMLFVAIIIAIIPFVDIDAGFSEQGYIFVWGMIVLLGFIGYIVGKVTSQIYIKRKAKEVKFNIFEIDLIDRMKQKGWFLLSDDKLVTTLNFTKKENDFGKIFDKNVQKLD